MGAITLFLIALGLAMDAFSVAVTDGILLKNLKIQNAVKIALFFGIFQFGMLLFGHIAGSAFSKYISAFDHWIAFFLLIIIGGKMFYDALKNNSDDESITDNKNPLSNKTLTILAIATSIDALAVGVSFAALNINILFACLIVGSVAFILSFLGVFIGNKFGNIFKNNSEIFGGIVLMLIGIKTLIEHLFF